MTIKEFQQLIEQIYYTKDKKRGLAKTFCWFCEEVGELARAIRSEKSEKLAEEFADVFAWLVSLASLCQIDLATAIRKYQPGCPKCKRFPCGCKEKSVRRG